MEATAIDALLNAAVRKNFGSSASVANLTRLTAGASCESWRFDVTHGGLVDPDTMVLRRPPLVARSNREEYFAQRLAPGRQHEAAILAVLEAADMAVPKVLFELHEDDGLGLGYVMNFLAGEALPPRILKADDFAAARAALPGQITSFRYQLNAVDIASLAFLPEDTAASQIELFEEILDWQNLRHPGLELGLSWLKDHLPDPAPAKLVHGDYRLSNFLITNDGLNAVIDWELAHLGNPLEDLAWLCVRSWRFSRPDLAASGLTDRRGLLANWCAVSGEVLPLHDLIFWEVLGNVKWAILCLLMGQKYLSGTDKSIELAVVGRRVEEPVYDLIRLIDGRDGQMSEENLSEDGTS
ncbi:MAG: phosphotransferase family protein [Alphaproteobacteria bacterium]|jgi:aminoglycoside phosphotransferase (APT) family kinase protein|nr:phosphotransferase family protein [Alphaproteobacteria bacterium]MBT4019048.1 phosphotransferase family protein [Alphaproteobacteria bacterium]MBT4966498.1 phosphotransferase family protein [Alphaproteobacteria bacterium]MBT5919908.1 phosphotransferase family protein [Alphaproteobacteria bacterium]MBT6385928.1 phosphotransferase family protein [Alphaproteobacteria bacterium]